MSCDNCYAPETVPPAVQVNPCQILFETACPKETPTEASAMCIKKMTGALREGV